MRFELKNQQSHLLARRHRGTGAVAPGCPVQKRVAPHQLARNTSHYHGRELARHQEELSKGAQALWDSLDAGPQREYSGSEMNTASAMLGKLRRGDDLRQSKVEGVRESVAANQYDDDPTLDIVVDRLMEDLFD